MEEYNRVTSGNCLTHPDHATSIFIRMHVPKSGGRERGSEKEGKRELAIFFRTRAVVV